MGKNPIAIVTFPGVGTEYVVKNIDSLSSTNISVKHLFAPFVDPINLAKEVKRVLVEGMTDCEYVFLSYDARVMSVLRGLNIPYLLVVPDDTPVMRQVMYGRYFLAGLEHDALSRKYASVVHNYDSLADMTILKGLTYMHNLDYMLTVTVDKPYLSDLMPTIRAIYCFENEKYGYSLDVGVPDEDAKDVPEIGDVIWTKGKRASCYMGQYKGKSCKDDKVISGYMYVDVTALVQEKRCTTSTVQRCMNDKFLITKRPKSYVRCLFRVQIDKKATARIGGFAREGI